MALTNDLEPEQPDPCQRRGPTAGLGGRAGFRYLPRRRLAVASADDAPRFGGRLHALTE